MSIKPKQRIPQSEKINNEEYKNNIMEYYDEMCNNFTKTKDGLDKWYRIANGELIEEDYSAVTNPYGKASDSRPYLKKFPVKLRNYSIITPLLNRLLGEKSKRPVVRSVVAENTDFPEIKAEAEKELIFESLASGFINKLQEIGADLGNLPQEQPLTPLQIKEIIENLRDEKAISGERGLASVEEKQELIRKFRQGFDDWLITGLVFSYKDIVGDEVDYHICSPKHIDFLMGSDKEFIEDGEAVKYSRFMPLNEVIDRFQDILKEEQLEALESRSRHASGYNGARGMGFTDIDPSGVQTLFTNMFGPATLSSGNEDVLVTHIVYRDLIKIGMLRTVDVSGKSIEIEVDEDFKPLKGEEVEWKWVDQIWEGYIIDDRFTVGVQPIPMLRGDFYKPWNAKLTYNGRIYAKRDTTPISVVQRLYPYQIKYNIIHYRLEHTLAKNKDKITFLPYGMIPKEQGWDEFRVMYYADALGYSFYDETDKNVLTAMNAVKAIDMSLNQYIQWIYNHLTQTKREAEELVGFTGARTGDTKTSDSVSNVQESIYRGTLVTEDMFLAFDEFQEREFRGLLDLTQYAYQAGKRLTYKDGIDYQVYEVPPFYQHVKFNVFVKSTPKQYEKLQQLKANAQAFAQNQMKPSTLAKIIDMDDYEALMKMLEEDENRMMAMQEQQLQAQQAAENAKLESENYNKEADRINKIEVAHINANARLGSQIIASDTSLASIGGAGEQVDTSKIMELKSRNAIEWQRMLNEREKFLDDNATKRFVAKENKNKYDVKSK